LGDLRSLAPHAVRCLARRMLSQARHSSVKTYKPQLSVCSQSTRGPCPAQTGSGAKMPNSRCACLKNAESLPDGKADPGGS
ncbi:MAG: hypothetical protein II595_01935, partial [Desulfovibrio sp.]|nr:hypothetical protein [Desulfovibrio sp.]